MLSQHLAKRKEKKVTHKLHVDRNTQRPKTNPFKAGHKIILIKPKIDLFSSRLYTFLFVHKCPPFCRSRMSQPDFIWVGTSLNFLINIATFL